MIAGVSKIDKGKIEKSTNAMVIYDELALYPNLSGIDNLRLFTNFRIADDKLLNAARKFVSDDVLKRRMRSYSLGEGKKLLFALFELLSPKISIMDEVSNGIDFSTIQLFKKRLGNIESESILILTGHQFDFYNDLVDDLYIIVDNKIKEIDNWKEIGIENVYHKFYERDVLSSQK